MTMFTIRIEHPVPDFDAWKQAFDRDPLGRDRSGVSHYRVMRPMDEPGVVVVDLDFQTSVDAQTFLVRLREMWRGMEGTIMSNPHAQILSTVEDSQT
jgi:hypothetical protein